MFYSHFSLALQKKTLFCVKLPYVCRYSDMSVFHFICLSSKGPLTPDSSSALAYYFPKFNTAKKSACKGTGKTRFKKHANTKYQYPGLVIKSR